MHALTEVPLVAMNCLSRFGQAHDGAHEEDTKPIQITPALLMPVFQSAQMRKCRQCRQRPTRALHHKIARADRNYATSWATDDGMSARIPYLQNQDTFFSCTRSRPASDGLGKPSGAALPMAVMAKSSHLPCMHAFRQATVVNTSVHGRPLKCSVRLQGAVSSHLYILGMYGRSTCEGGRKSAGYS